MNSIEIKRNGLTVSRVHFGTTVSGAARHLHGKCFLIHDAAVGKYAAELVDAVNAAPVPVRDTPARSSGTLVDTPETAMAAGSARILGRFALGNVSETGKTLFTVEDICRWLLETGADRDATIIALGGGILTDIVGLAAAVYKRGVGCVYIPTTLLAQVDAAIGGKTGVNLDAYKNIIGVFRQPEFTHICPEVLETLPDGIFRAGLAELLKTFIIDNGPVQVPNPVSAETVTPGSTEDSFPSRITGRIGRLLSVVRKINASGGFPGADPATKTEFGTLVAEAAAIKAGIVSRDEFEGGERRKLNLGHTFAHAIEHNVNVGVIGTISHGEAVAIGTAMAARLSVNLGLAAPQVEADILEALTICGLPTECPCPAADLPEAMRKDKKNDGGTIHTVLIRALGEVTVRDLTVSEIAANL